MIRSLSSAVAALLLVLAPPAFAAQATLSEQNDARAHFQRGLAHFNLGEYELAIEAVTRAYRLEPIPLLLFNIGLSHFKLGHYEEAARFFERFLASAPSHARAAEAREWLDKSKRGNPPSYEGFTVGMSEPAARAVLARTKRSLSCPARQRIVGVGYETQALICFARDREIELSFWFIEGRLALMTAEIGGETQRKLDELARLLTEELGRPPAKEARGFTWASRGGVLSLSVDGSVGGRLGLRMSDRTVERALIDPFPETER